MKSIKVYYEIEMYEKKSDDYVKSYLLPDKTNSFYRDFLGITEEKVPLLINITPKLKEKFKKKLDIDIDIDNYDCFFCELGKY